jgi:hypothetical protein
VRSGWSGTPWRASGRCARPSRAGRSCCAPTPPSTAWIEVRKGPAGPIPAHLYATKCQQEVGMQDVVDLIEADHREVERLFEALKSQPEQRALELPVLSAALIALSRGEEARSIP